MYSWIGIKTFIFFFVKLPSTKEPIMHIQIKTKNMADPEHQQDFKVWISDHSQTIDWFSQDFKVWKIPNQKWMNSQGFKAWMKTNIYCNKIHDMPFCQYIMLNLTFDNIFQYNQFFHVFIHQLFIYEKTYFIPHLKK